MLSVYAVYVTTLAYSWQYWMPLVHWDRQGLTVKLTLPGDALLVAILDNQRFTHTAGEAPKVGSVALLSVDSPS